MQDSTLIEFKIPDSDAMRRREVFLASRDAAEFSILALPDGPLVPLPDTFFHMSVIAGPRGFETHLGTEHAFPIGSPYLASPFPTALSDFPIRIHRVNLSADTDLQITLMRVPGRLLVPVTFTSSEPASGIGLDQH